MKKLLAAVAVASVLGAGAFVASTVASNPANAQTTETQTQEAPERPDRGEALDEVLGGLVTDGVLDQGQADAVRDALEAKHEELQAAREERRAEHEAARELIMGFLDDDVISADELAQLEDDHPFNDADGPFASATADGEITKAELDELRGDHRGHRGPGAGADEAVSPNA